MNHERASELLLDRAYGELAPAEARELEAHLAGCAGCRAEGERIERTRVLMRQLGPEPEPGGEGILLAAARQAADARKPRFSWLTLSLATGALATVLVAVLTVRAPAPPPADRAEEAYAARPVPLQAPAGGAAPAAAPAETAPPPVASAPARPAPPPVASAPAAAEEPPVRALRAPGRGLRPVRQAAGPAPEETPLAAREPERKAAKAAAAPEPEARREETAAGAAVAHAPAADRLREAAPRAGAAGLAPAASAPAAPLALEARVAAPSEAAEALVGELQGRRDAGELNEARRRPDPCPGGGGDSSRLVWLDGWGKARRFARTGPAPGGGEATRDHYYDDAGRARLVVIEGEGAGGHFRRRIVLDGQGRRLLEDPPDAPSWPDSDLALRDGAAAFWAPQRCGR